MGGNGSYRRELKKRGEKTGESQAGARKKKKKNTLTNIKDFGSGTR